MKTIAGCLALGCALLLPIVARSEDLLGSPPPRAVEPAGSCTPMTSPETVGVPKPLPAQSSICPSWAGCSSGCNVTCNGSYCYSYIMSVTCDGVTTYCPGLSGCNPPSDCADPCGYCECYFQGGHRCLLNYCSEWW